MNVQFEWFLENYIVVQCSSWSSFRTLPSTQQVPSYSSGVGLHFHIYLQAITDLICLYGFAFSRNFLKVESYNEWSIVSDFFSVACFWGLSVLLHVSVIPFYCWARVRCFNIPYFLNTVISWWIFGVVPSFWLLLIMVLWIFMYKPLCGYMLSFLFGR